MRIAYCGFFLQEGFRQAGCEVFPFRLEAGKTLDVAVEAVCDDPDLVFIEVFGKMVLPLSLHSRRHRLAIYCIDSPLNAFWLIPLATLCDYVYVDQLSSVSLFRKNGVAASWLPLCVSQHEFRGPADKKHFMTFVGRVSQHRTKRNNLLACVQRHFSVNVVQDVSPATMLDIFAASRVVLNENFFSGLNLRFLQVLASGSLLLTERKGVGVQQYFQEKTHYVGYAPGDLLDTLHAIEQRPDTYAAIAAAGQEAGRRGHTSEHRALAVLADVEQKGKTHSVLSLPEKKFHEAHAAYWHAMRFGGIFDEAVMLFRDVADGPAEVAVKALGFLGTIHLQAGHKDKAIACLEPCALQATVDGLAAALKLMLLCIDDEVFFTYLSMLVALLSRLGLARKKYARRLSELTQPTGRLYACCMLGWELLSDLGINHALGFYKQYQERFPDFALEYGLLAFKTQMTSESLEAIIRSTRKAGIPSEALPYIKQAILAGAASDEQIAQSVPLAIAYYDFDYASSVTKTLKTTLVP